MLLYEGKLSLLCFLSPILLAILVIFSYLEIDVFIEIEESVWWILLSYVIFINIIIHILLTDYAYQIAVRAAFLGSVFTSGLLAAWFLPDPLSIFGWYMCVMAFFHYSEFLTIAITNPRTLSIDSYILNHSNEYIIAAITSWVEFFIEVYFFPELKEMRLVSYMGLCLCVGGECMRKLAMLTAQGNFNHVVQSVRRSDHELVTHGVYRICRHPSYVGWFYWSMGTQMILVNPLCFVAYILASWKFFNDRITVEELTLLNFFGEKYLEYQDKVGTGLPLISGYRLEQ
uniref:Protein-S-isoprenylcysteine O-methyltransferase n=1 Tax=Cuerna arida TaxID=1464854 RepID=A0A1B6EVX0_9HEMI